MSVFFVGKQQNLCCLLGPCRGPQCRDLRTTSHCRRALPYAAAVVNALTNRIDTPAGTSTRLGRFWNQPGTQRTDASALRQVVFVCAVARSSRVDDRVHLPSPGQGTATSIVAVFGNLARLSETSSPCGYPDAFAFSVRLVVHCHRRRCCCLRHYPGPGR